MQDEALTVEEIAELVQVEPDTVRAWLVYSWRARGRARRTTLRRSVGPAFRPR
jgi:hypothetical protein